MCKENGQSIEVVYQDLSETFPTISLWVFESPGLILGYLNQVLLDAACWFYPGYESIHEETFVRIADFPLEEKIRDLRTYHINILIKIKGVITKKYPIYQRLQKLFYICVKCGDKKGPIIQNDEQTF